MDRLGAVVLWVSMTLVVGLGLGVIGHTIVTQPMSVINAAVGLGLGIVLFLSWIVWVGVIYKLYIRIFNIGSLTESQYFLKRECQSVIENIKKRYQHKRQWQEVDRYTQALQTVGPFCLLRQGK